MNDTLTHACEMFLLPTTISFIAFGIAPTQKLKTPISVYYILDRHFDHHRFYYHGRSFGHIPYDMDNFCVPTRSRWDF
jgi:hypothetical protein